MVHCCVVKYRKCQKTNFLFLFWRDGFGMVGDSISNSRESVAIGKTRSYLPIIKQKKLLKTPNKQKLYNQRKHYPTQYKYKYYPCKKKARAVTFLLFQISKQQYYVSSWRFRELYVPDRYCTCTQIRYWHFHEKKSVYDTTHLVQDKCIVYDTTHLVQDKCIPHVS
jgi:hypothetical protein